MARTPAPRSRSSLTPVYAILGVIALAGVGWILYQTVGGKEAPATEPVAVVLSPEELNRVQGIAIGDPDAPVTIMEFADFQCPGCGQFAWRMAPLIKERLVETGKARFVYYDFPLPMHGNAFLASRAGRCANEQGVFWKFHDILYGQQRFWSDVPTSKAAEQFVEYAEQAGADPAAFEACLRSDRYAREVTESIKLGESLGVEGTPTIFINNQRYPGVPGSVRELEEAVARAAGGAAAPAAEPAPEAHAGHEHAQGG